ncbi:Tat proofreading chaperone DmsD [Chimaeribacter arupi]|uniref:Tat proofreading chaperone DmsD n=1 Tax=Chimaeribacter arupi TaxID=2060066 RepID=A0A2N5ETQ2_9GAMM|nr:Tat proofreading chaperone DmsD [Chimaeribacter arupi]PLR53476.1 Tat proofreading chaperone DmsD [Chimaeribacter arupi]
MLQNLALTGRLCGALLYHPPGAPEFETVKPLFMSAAWVRAWPYGTDDELSLLAERFAQHAHEPLNDVYQRLFIGPDALAAPPWGSVYLDRDGVVFGDSTLALRHWLAARGITSYHPPQEPEDHIGLLLLMAAWLAEERPADVDAFLAGHLLPWAPRYLTLLEPAAGHPFYQAAASLTRLTLAGWHKAREIEVPAKTLYR